MLPFAAFALSPAKGGVALSQAPSQPSQPPEAPPLPPLLMPDPDRDAWAAGLYQALAASPLLAPTLEARLPTVPVILHPSAPRGGPPPPVTARHLGFLRVDLTGESAGPGRFFPLFPADAAEETVGVDTGSLDDFGCTGHWASSGCIRLLTASAAPSGSDSGGALQLLPPEAFSALWERRSDGSGVEGSSSEVGGGGDTGGAGSSSPGGGEAAGVVDTSSGNGQMGSLTGGPAGSPAGASWHVPYSRLFPLEEAYGGLYRELKAAGHDLSRAHYMLRGWKTREGRPRLGGSAPRHVTATTGRQRRGVVPAELAATRDMRAMVNWPGLLELLEEEGVQSVPTDGVRYWLARLGAGFQARLAAAGVLCAETSVHHIIARSARGIDHPLNYFLIDRGPNSSMGSRVEGFRDANGVKLHMRDIVGERAFEVAQAACNLYHGLLYAGRLRGQALSETLRELREGAVAAADEAIAERAAREARRHARAGGAASGGGAAAAVAGEQQEEEGQEQQHERGQQQQQQQQESGGLGSQPRSCLKRERPPSSQGQQQGTQGSKENTPDNATLLSPSQQQQERRRRLAPELCQALSAAMPAAAEAGAAEAAGAAAAEAATAEDAGSEEDEEEEEVKAGLATLSMLCSSQEEEGIPLAAEVAADEAGQSRQQQQQQQQQPKPAAVDLSSLRARLQAVLGAAGGCG